MQPDQQNVDHQREADERLARALEESPARDPREEYRALLRELKSQSDADYEQAVGDYRKSVVEAIAGGDADPIRAWLEFGCRLAERLRPGRAVVVSPEGRAVPYLPPPSPAALILHLPNGNRGRGVVVGAPRELSRAQKAAKDLLALGKVKL
jgi:hypothetical protein